MTGCIYLIVRQPDGRSRQLVRLWPCSLIDRSLFYCIAAHAGWYANYSAIIYGRAFGSGRCEPFRNINTLRRLCTGRAVGGNPGHIASERRSVAAIAAVLDVGTREIPTALAYAARRPKQYNIFYSIFGCRPCVCVDVNVCCCLTCVFHMRVHFICIMRARTADTRRFVCVFVCAWSTRYRAHATRVRNNVIKEWTNAPLPLPPPSYKYDMCQTVATKGMFD